jgi:hypothetical protein
MPRKPNATSPNAKIAVDAGSMIDPSPTAGSPTSVMPYASAISPPIVTAPTQNPEKLPETRPLSTFERRAALLAGGDDLAHVRLWTEVKIL